MSGRRRQSVRKSAEFEHAPLLDKLAASGTATGSLSCFKIPHEAAGRVESRAASSCESLETAV